MTTLSRILAAGALLLMVASVRADNTAVEYYHAQFDHYFVTANTDEIAKLDGGVFAGWSRTGKAFDVYASGTANTAPTCRFFSTAFGEKSSHFYTSSASECTTVKSNPDWQFEGEVFNVALPATDGSCPSATKPVYRVYNNGQGGAPNHRFVTSLDDRQAMLDKGYVAEGEGIGVSMCAPDGAPPRTTPEGIWRGTTDRGQTVRVLVAGSTLYVVYWDNLVREAGIIAGAIAQTGTTFVSVRIDSAPILSSLRGLGDTIRGAVADGSLTIDFGQTQATMTYERDYDHAIDIAALAGDYIGAINHRSQAGADLNATLDAQRHFSIEGNECGFVAEITPRPGVGVADVVYTSTTGNCAGVVSRGVMLYDAATKRISILSEAFNNPRLGFRDVIGIFATRQ